MQRLILSVTRHLRMLLQVIRPNMDFSYEWPIILQDFKQLKPKIKVITVLWEFQKAGWVKYNTNGASKGNLWRSSRAFCLRDLRRDLLYTEGTIIEDTNNMEAEAMAILNVAIHYNQSEKDKVIIQTDTFAIQKILSNEWESPSNIADKVS